MASLVHAHSATVERELREASSVLAPSPTASLDAQLLLAHVLGRDRNWLIGHSEARLEEESRAQFSRLIDRRLRGEPVAYLRGYVDWWDLRLDVGPGVLVPRPETEVLLEAAIGIGTQSGARTVADIGTGSGALAIGLGRELAGSRVFAVDSEDRALSLARRNVRKYELTGSVHLLEGSLIDPIQNLPDLIVANLPYLSEAMMANLPIDVRYEPTSALLGGSSGCELYAELFELCSKRSWTCPLVIEFHPPQRAHLTRLAGEFFPETGVTVRADYSGNDRVMVIGL